MKVIANIAHNVVAEIDGKILSISRLPGKQETVANVSRVILNKEEAENLIKFIQRNMEA